jgi:hypothetical protein
VEDRFEEEISSQGHSTGTDLRWTLMPTYLKMTFVPKVTMILKRMTGKTQAADTGLILHDLDLLM